MKVLIVYAHPISTSLSHSILETVEKGFKDRKCEVVVRDLYALKFDPVLTVEDFKQIFSGTMPPDIAEEQKFVSWADLLVFICPIWSAHWPAILKGYIDRVYSNGFAYKVIGGKVVPQLNYKKALVFSPYGTPNELYGPFINALNLELNDATFKFCGVQTFEPYYFGNADYINREQGGEILKKVKTIVEKYPITMKSLVIYKDIQKGVKLIDLPIPDPTPGTVIIKVAAAPINPSDLYIIGEKEQAFRKVFTVSKEPQCIGSECSGTVVAFGEKVPPNYLGRKVAFSIFGQNPDTWGTYSQYARINFMQCLLLENNVDLIEASGLLSNPITVMGILELVKKLGSKYVVNTPGASSLGKMLYLEGKKSGVEVISIVRSQKSLEILKRLGATLVFDSSSATFEADFSKKVQELGVNLLFDGVCGEAVSKWISLMPMGSTIYVYGVIGGNVPKLSCMQLAMRNITIKCFTATQAEFLHKFDTMMATLKYIADDISTPNSSFKTQIDKKFSLEEYEDAIKYAKSTNSSGKPIFIPN